MKRLLTICLAAGLSLNLYCQIHWTKYAGNPVMVPGAAEEWDKDLIAPSSVVYVDSVYYMYYGGGNFFETIRTGLATSQDGIHWTKSPSNPVLDVGPEGAWDESSVFAGRVLIIDSVFHMWYTGHMGLDMSEEFRIGHATSPDGINWTKDTANPILNPGSGGSWDDKIVTIGSAVFDGTTYHVWYGAFSREGTSGLQIGHATSSDAITWAKDPENPVFNSGGPGNWEYPRIDFPSVIYDGTIFHMWYTGGELFAGQVGYATSENGSAWEPYEDNPVLRTGPEGSWDESGAFFCTVIDSANVKYKMWYSGGQMEYTGSIGYAETFEPGPGSISDSRSLRMDLFPNPSAGIITLRMEFPDRYSVEIISSTGQLMYREDFMGKRLEINMSRFSAGLYYMSVQSEKLNGTRKIIKW